MNPSFHDLRGRHVFLTARGTARGHDCPDNPRGWADVGGGSRDGRVGGEGGKVGGVGREGRGDGRGWVGGI